MTEPESTGEHGRLLSAIPCILWPLGMAAQDSMPPVWISIGILIGLLGLTCLAFVAGRRKSERENRHVLEAGRWALGKIRESTGERLAAGDAVSVRTELEKWIARVSKPAAATPIDLNEEMQVDLELAKDFQLAYLNRPYPKIPETHYEKRLRLMFHHEYQPALALGGDFFDIMRLAPDTAGVFIADVMGHGARSALITAILRTLLRDLKGQARNARHYVTEVNQELCEIMRSFPQPLFASAFYFVPDTTSRVATYSTAGHPAPYHLRRSLRRLTRLTVPAPHGAALGIIPNEEYTGGHVRLLEDDAFILFTDGVYEAANAEGEEFGLNRMEAVIREYMYKDAGIIIGKITGAIREFVGDTPLSDDICLVAVEVTTKSEDDDSAKREPAPDA